MVGSLPASAGGTGSGPGLGGSRMPRSNRARAPRLLSLCSGACEPQLLKLTRLEPMLRNRRGHRNERPMHCSEEWPLLATTRESPSAATKTQCSQREKQIPYAAKNKIKNKQIYIKIKYLKHFKKKKKKVKRQSTELEKIFANHVPDKGLVSGIYKELITQQQKDKQPNSKIGKGLE